MGHYSPSKTKLAEIRFEVLLSRLPVTRQVHDIGLGNAHLIMKMLAESHYKPDEVHITHQPLAPMSVYTRFFGAKVCAAQPFAALFVRPQLLKLPMSAVNGSLRQMAVDYLTELFPAPGQTYSARVNVAIRKMLGTHMSSKEGVAAMLATHPRTLQRRLVTEGTSFDDIRDEVRRELALRYLTSTQMPLIQIVGLLGLSEPAVLTRLCKRWFGATPSTIRGDPRYSESVASAAKTSAR